MARVIPADPGHVAVDEAVGVLRSGGTLVLPTDTVYGIAGLPGRPEAIARIFELKERPPGMHLAVLVSGPEQLGSLTDDTRVGMRAVAEAFWPGALTLVLPQATPFVAGLGANDDTVGVRCPDHSLVRAIAAHVGPIATTSANLHGRPTPELATEVAAQLPGADLVIDGGPCRGGVASSVISLVGDYPEQLRAGPVPLAAVRAVWGPRPR